MPWSETAAVYLSTQGIDWMVDGQASPLLALGITLIAMSLRLTWQRWIRP